LKEASKTSQHQNEVKNKEHRKYSDWSQGKPNNAEGKCKDEDGKYSKKLFNCFKCGNQHGINKYPAFGKNFKVCGKLNHFGVMCKSKEKNSNYQVNEVNQNKEREVTYLLLNTIENEKCNNWTDTVSIDNIEMVVKLDTGAQLNVMPLEQLKKPSVSSIIED